jgi:hypothetical protein
MSSATSSKSPRIRNILISRTGDRHCCICGKDASKHPGHRPAPVGLFLEFASAIFKNDFVVNAPKTVDVDSKWAPCAPGEMGVPKCLAETGWQLARNLRIGGSICLACAKRISSRLDAVIEQIESEYRGGLHGKVA